MRRVVCCSMLITEFQFELLHVSTVFPAVSTPWHTQAPTVFAFFRTPCTCNRVPCYIQMEDWICADITVWNCRQK